MCMIFDTYKLSTISHDLYLMRCWQWGFKQRDSSENKLTFEHVQ